jgi:hypothetical protein
VAAISASAISLGGLDLCHRGAFFSFFSLLQVRGTFSENQESTIGAAFLTRTVDLPAASVKLQVRG